jgi:hypothetical protein
MRDQIPLMEVVGRFAPLGAQAGFIASSIDTASMSVTIYWHGRLTPAAQRLVDTVPAGITLVMVAAPFSRATLDDTVARLKAVMHQTGITFIGNDNTGDGFHLQFGDPQHRDAALAATMALRTNTPVLATVQLPAALETYRALLAEPGEPPIRIRTRLFRLRPFGAAPEA